MTSAMHRTARQGFPPIVENPFPFPPAMNPAEGLEPNAKRYRMGAISIILGNAPATGSYHLSIAHPSRYPTWDEIAHARYTLVPDQVTMALLLPPQAEYVNFHPNCFHLWQVNPGVI